MREKDRLIRDLEQLADEWFSRETDTEKDPDPIDEVSRRRKELREVIQDYD